MDNGWYKGSDDGKGYSTWEEFYENNPEYREYNETLTRARKDRAALDYKAGSARAKAPKPQRKRKECKVVRFEDIQGNGERV